MKIYKLSKNSTSAHLDELISKMKSMGYLLYTPSSDKDQCIKYANGDTFLTFALPDNSVKLGIELISLNLDYRGDIIPTKTLDNEKIITIAGIYTDPKFRGKGLANKITNDFMLCSSSLGIQIDLEPSQMRNYTEKNTKSLTNKQLADWYKRKGFKRKFEGRDGILSKS